MGNCKLHSVFLAWLGLVTLAMSIACSPKRPDATRATQLQSVDTNAPNRVLPFDPEEAVEPVDIPVIDVENQGGTEDNIVNNASICSGPGSCTAGKYHIPDHPTIPFTILLASNGDFCVYLDSTITPEPEPADELLAYDQYLILVGNAAPLPKLITWNTGLNGGDCD